MSKIFSYPLGVEKVLLVCWIGVGLQASQWASVDSTLDGRGGVT